jgi:hypothetical protein
MGLAFLLSGQNLDKMKAKSDSGMAVAIPGMIEERALKTLTVLVDAISIRWTDAQARAILGALRGSKQKEIAMHCWDKPVSQQAVAQHLDRASWNGIRIALAFFEESIQHWMANNKP